MTSKNGELPEPLALADEELAVAKPTQDFVESWLSKNGVLLELKVASLFRKNLPKSISSSVSHGRIYIDQESGNTLRECDVVVNFTVVMRHEITLTIWLIIECKSSMKSPWVFYRGDKASRWSERYEERFNSKTSNEFNFQSVIGLPSIQLFDVQNKNFSYSVGTATNENDSKDKRNLAREAILQVLSATKGVMDDSLLPNDRPAGVIFIPIVVTKAEMFSVSLIEDGELQVTPTDSELVINRFISVNGNVDSSWVIQESKIEDTIKDFCQGLEYIDYN